VILTGEAPQLAGLEDDLARLNPNIRECQGRSKTRPVWRSKSRPVDSCVVVVVLRGRRAAGA
jgi:hypothetical protein